MNNLAVKYTWRQLTEEGLLIKIKTQEGYGSISFFDTLYNSEEDAINDLVEEFNISSKPVYISPSFVIVKVYGVY